MLPVTSLVVTGMKNTCFELEVIFTFSSKERELKWSKVLSFCKLKNFITYFGVFQEIKEVEGL